MKSGRPVFTEEFCNREYNARAMIPDHAAIFARWAHDAAIARQQLAGQLDLPYGTNGTSGNSGAERLDFFPAARRDAPLLVFIHGGFWRAMDKADFSWLARPFNERGVAVAIPNYGLAPATALEEIVRQTLRASAWLWRAAPRLGFDRERMVVSGHSAGGHLTAMMLAARWPDWSPDLPGKLYHGGLAISGLFDLEPLRHASYLNVDLKLTPERVGPLSPLFMTPASDAPLVTAVGALESGEFLRQTDDIARAWKSVFRARVPMPGENHLTVCDRLADPRHALFAAALALCDA